MKVPDCCCSLLVVLLLLVFILFRLFATYHKEKNRGRVSRFPDRA